mgnify:CR=1 FL=1
MSCEKKFKDELRARGFRLTPQREAVLEALHEVHGCTTAEALHELVSRRDLGVDLATVYRTLEVLAEIDFVKCIETGRKERLWEFLGEKDPHPHFLCRLCGQLYGLEDAEFLALQRHLQERYGFSADLHHLTIPGLCASCREKAHEGSATPTSDEHP